MKTQSHLSALTAGYFGLGQSNQTARSHHTALRYAPGSSLRRLRPAAYDLLRKSHLAPSANAEGCCTRALQSPPLGLLKSQFVLPGLLRA
jgi:hypothetical protein